MFVNIFTSLGWIQPGRADITFLLSSGLGVAYGRASNVRALAGRIGAGARWR